MPTSAAKIPAIVKNRGMATLPDKPRAAARLLNQGNICGALSTVSAMPNMINVFISCRLALFMFCKIYPYTPFHLSILRMQEGLGCPVLSLLRSGDSVARIIKYRVMEYLKRQGGNDLDVSEAVKAFSGHSLRAGFVTTAFEKGVPEASIMPHTRHKKAETLYKYRRMATVFQDNPSARVGL